MSWICDRSTLGEIHCRSIRSRSNIRHCSLTQRSERVALPFPRQRRVRVLMACKPTHPPTSVVFQSVVAEEIPCDIGPGLVQRCEVTGSESTTKAMRPFRRPCWRVSFSCTSKLKMHHPGRGNEQIAALQHSATAALVQRRLLRGPEKQAQASRCHHELGGRPFFGLFFLRQSTF